MTVVRKIHIENYRVFQDFSLDFDSGVNILVGDNDVGKSTLLEAVNLALTSRLGDRYLGYALSPYLFNRVAAKKYTDAIAVGKPATPPEFLIDLFLEDDGGAALATLCGRNNVDAEDCPGLRIRAAFDPAYSEEHASFIQDTAQVALVPTEYYKVEWLSFAGNAVTRRGLPLKPSRIDASEIRLQSGADYHLQEIISARLETSERVELARAYRSLRETFANNAAIQSINEDLAESPANLSTGDLRLSIDVSLKTAWETSLVPHLEDLPFQFIGNGSRSMLKVLLALHRSRDVSQVVLIEEPENHLSPANLNRFVDRISDCCEDRQVLIATHSSYVLNKLGLDRLLLVGPQTKMRLRDLPAETLDYFKKLSGYDTLRLVLAERAILVEGPSDDLIVQRAYRDAHGKLPIEDGVDVINAAGCRSGDSSTLRFPSGSESLS